MNYYLYRHVRLDTNEVFYVGIGKKTNFNSFKSEYKRAFQKFRNKFWTAIVNKTNYEVDIMFETDSIEEIKNKEIELIKLYGRRDLGLGTLCNLTDGGEGTYGYKFSQDSLNKLRDSHVGIPNKIKGKNYEEAYGIEKAQSIKKLMSQKAQVKIGIKNNFFGKSHSLEYKRERGKEVEQFDINGKYLNTFYTLSEAAEATNSDVRLISAVCLGKRKTHNNFKWSFKVQQQNNEIYN